MGDTRSVTGDAVRIDRSAEVGAEEQVSWLDSPGEPEVQRASLSSGARRAVLVVWDAAVWPLALFLAWALRDELDLSEIDGGTLRTGMAVAVVAQLVVGAIAGVYRGRRTLGSLDDAINVSGATVLAGFLVFLINFFAAPQLVPRSVPLLAVPIAVMIAVGARIAVRLHRERDRRPDRSAAQRVIIYGAGPEGQQLMRSMLADPDAAFLPVALLDDDVRLRRRRIHGVTVQGTRLDVTEAAASTSADLLVIADRSLHIGIVREISAAATAAGIEVAMLPSLTESLRPLPPGLLIPAPRSDGSGHRPAELDPRRERVKLVGGTTAPAAPVQSKTKRMFDVVLCLMSVLLILPLLILIAVVLKVSSGEVLYRAQRIGRDGKPFTMFKFATMVPGEVGPRVTREGDPRITPVGRWLRASKLNELPQIFNVIKGDMSLVGPRPEDPRYAAFYSPRQRRVFSVRPGMTSLAFLEFGDEQAFLEKVAPVDIESFYLEELLPEKLDIELQYVSNWTMREDLRILARTLKELLT
jgi:lipopolysaccharide/colanic/teichoic acid biosynthesis glycosyltransferase